MNAEVTAQLARLLRERRVAALGTLHAGAPSVSMVPYAIAQDSSGLLIHVSSLSAHTKDMRADPRVSLLVVEAEASGASALELPRVSIQGTSHEVPPDSPEQSGFKATYLQRFPEASQMFGFADFTLFRIQPESLRFIAGFAQAYTFPGESFAQMLQAG